MSGPKTKLDEWLGGANFDDHFFGEALEAVTATWECDIDDAPYQNDIRKQFLWRLGQFECLAEFHEKFARLCQIILMAEDKGDFSVVKSEVNKFRRETLSDVLYLNIEEKPFAHLEFKRMPLSVYTKQYAQRVDALLNLLEMQGEDLPEPTPEKKAAPKVENLVDWKLEFRLASSNLIEGARVLVEHVPGLTKFDKRLLEILMDPELDGQVSMRRFVTDGGLQSYYQYDLTPGLIGGAVKKINKAFQRKCGIDIAYTPPDEVRLCFRDLSELRQTVGGSGKKYQMPARPATRSGPPTPYKPVKEAPTSSALDLLEDPKPTKKQRKSPPKKEANKFKRLKGAELRPTQENWQSCILNEMDPNKVVRRMYEQLYSLDQRFHQVWEELLTKGNFSFEWIRHNGDFGAMDQPLGPKAVYEFVLDIEQLCKEIFGFAPFYFLGDSGGYPVTVHVMGKDAIRKEKIALRERWEGDTPASGGPNGSHPSGPTLDLIDRKPKPAPATTSSPPPAKPKPKVLSIFEEAEKQVWLHESGEPRRVLRDLFQHLEKHEGVKWRKNQSTLFNQLLERGSMDFTACGKCGVQYGKGRLHDKIYDDMNFISRKFEENFQFDPIAFGKDTFTMDFDAASRYFEAHKQEVTLYVDEEPEDKPPEPDLTDLPEADGAPDHDLPNPEPPNPPDPTGADEVEDDTESDTPPSVLMQLCESVENRRNWTGPEEAIARYMLAHGDAGRVNPVDVCEYVYLRTRQRLSVSALRGYLPQVTGKLPNAMISRDGDGLMLRVDFDHSEKSVFADLHTALASEISELRSQDDGAEEPTDEPGEKASDSASDAIDEVDLRSQVEAMNFEGNQAVIVAFLLANQNQAWSMDEITHYVGDRFEFRPGKTEMKNQDYYNFFGRINKKFSATYEVDLIHNERGVGYYIGVLEESDEVVTPVVESPTRMIVWDFGPIEFGPRQVEQAKQARSFLSMLWERKCEDDREVPAPEIAEALFGDRENTFEVYELWTGLVKKAGSRFIQSRGRGAQAVYYVLGDAYDYAFETMGEVTEPVSDAGPPPIPTRDPVIPGPDFLQPAPPSEDPPPDNSNDSAPPSGSSDTGGPNDTAEAVDTSEIDISDIAEGMSQKLQILVVCLSNSGNITKKQIVSLNYSASEGAVGVQLAYINNAYKELSGTSDRLISTKSKKLCILEGVNPDLIEQLKASM